MWDERATGGEGRCFARGESEDEEGAVARILESHDTDPPPSCARVARSAGRRGGGFSNVLVGNRHWNSRELAGVCVSCPNNYNCFPWMTDNSELARIFAKDAYSQPRVSGKGARDKSERDRTLIDSPRDAFR